MHKTLTWSRLAGRRVAASLALLLASSRGARAQQAVGIEPLDHLVAALTHGSVAELQPYLTPETRIGTLPAAYSAQVLAQLVPQFGAVEAIRVVRREVAGDNVRYVCALTRQGTEKEYSFVLTPAGKFAELNLAQASVKKIEARLDPNSLTTPDQVTLPARLVNGLLVVQAEVDGRTGAFFFDSGAPALLLNQREFAPPSGQSTLLAQSVRGINGSAAGLSYYPLQRFACQGLTLQNKEVATLDMSSLEERLGGERLLGIIGYNLLSQYAVTLDYHDGQILLQKPGAPGVVPAPGVRVPFTLRGHLPLLAATIEGRPYQLALDCGAQTNLLDPAAEATLAGQLRHREQITLRGADATGRQVLSAEVPRLTLADGKLTFRHQATTFADVSHLNHNPGSVPLQGLLGYPLLREYRTTIDYVNQQVVFGQW
ncbi:MAG: aspartyl protease family protein [Janthinobacterium lividum]